MYRFTVDYKERDGADGSLFKRGYFLHGTPRLTPICRMFGHRPVVDGTGEYNADGDGGRYGSPYRWVACDRCGVRPGPQGSLDPAEWNIGDPYPGPFGEPVDKRDHATVKGTATHLPGPFPGDPTGALGAEIVVGPSVPGFGAEVKIGNAGSEHTLAAHLRVNPLGAVYLHTEHHGQWLQRRLNGVGYGSRVIGVSIGDGDLRWKIWAKRDEHSASDPRWMQGSTCIDPRDRLLGPKRYSYEDVGEPVTATVRMPEGDDHEVTLQLQSQSYGRTKSRKREVTWIADWDCRGGIPTRSDEHRGRITGSAVPVPEWFAIDGSWPQVAAARIAEKLAGDRARYGFVLAEELS